MVYSTLLRTDQKNNYRLNKIGTNYVPCGDTNGSTIVLHQIFSLQQLPSEMLDIFSISNYPLVLDYKLISRDY